MPKKKLIVSLIFQNPKNLGHDIDYNICVGKAAKLLNLNHTTLLSERWQNDQSIPASWMPCLQISDSQNKSKIFRVVEKIIELTPSLKKTIQNNISPLSHTVIFFMESFNLSHLISFYLAVYNLPPVDVKCVLLFRHNFFWEKKRFLYKLLIHLLSTKLGRTSLLLATDSDLVQKEASVYLNKPFHVMPMVHTDITDSFIDRSTSTSKEKQRIICWWPGFPKIDKGPTIVEKILREKNDYSQYFKIIAANISSFKQTPGGPTLELIDDHLDRVQYARMFRACDVILLPYDNKTYVLGTSGIFVEAISAGKVVFVTNGTWMAYELRQLGLDDLIIDWSHGDILKKMYHIYKDETVKKRIEKMQIYYRKKHSIANFSEIFGKLTQN